MKKKGPRPLPGPPSGWSAQLQRVQRGPTPGSSSSIVQQAPTPGSSSSDQHRLLAAPPPAPTPTPANASPFANTASQRQKDWGWLQKEIKQRLEAQKDAAFDAAFDAASTPTPAPAPTPAPHNDETRAFGVFGRKREADKSWQQDVCFPNLRDQDFDEDGMMARKSIKDKSSKDEDKEARAVRNAPAAATPPKKRAGPEGSQGSRARRARRPCQGGDDEGSQGSDVINSPCSQASTFSLASEWRETFEELEQEAGSGEAEDQEGCHEGAD